ncbi:hypothetical protein CC78DRAFT_408447, partial [Lojkania enalia]
LDSDFLEMAVANIQAFMLAGAGRTTDALFFLFMHLSIHPDVVEKLRREHRCVYSSDVDETYLILQSHQQKLRELDYTTNVIKGTLGILPI